MSEITPSGYQFFHKPRVGKRGGGVGLFLKSCVVGTLVNTPVFESFEQITINSNFGNRTINLVSLYRPPGSSAKFLLDLPKFLEMLQSLPSESLLFGDVNIDPIKNNSAYQKYTDILNDFDLVQHVKTITHIHGNTLDHLIVPNNVPVKSTIIADCFSDHMCIKSILGIDVSFKSATKVFLIRCFKKFDKLLLRSDLVKSELIISLNYSSSQKKVI